MPSRQSPTAIRTSSLGLLLTDGFALMSYASIVECYRAANMLAGAELYRWEHFSIDGKPVRASNGATILADRMVGQAHRCDTLFVFAAGDPTRFEDPATFAWLRYLAATGATIVGVSGGPFVLAQAGLLDGHRATIHWDHRPAFSETFPTIRLEPGLYVIDRRRVTCAGGIAGLDLAIELIEREQGHDLATRISDWFIRTEQRLPDRPQRLSLRDRYGIANDHVITVLAAMEASVEEPLTREALAARVGISVRHLERLFIKHLNESVADRYMQIRLDQSQRLLRQTGLPITSVALACGFKSSGHFSTVFRRHVGQAPRAFRDRT